MSKQYINKNIYIKDREIQLNDLVSCMVLGISSNTWSSSSTYAKNDIVAYNKKLYINLTGTNTATTPDNDTTNWSETTILVNQ